MRWTCLDGLGFSEISVAVLKKLAFSDRTRSVLDRQRVIVRFIHLH